MDPLLDYYEQISKYQQQTNKKQQYHHHGKHQLGDSSSWIRGCVN
jgi:hypothetical protein